MTNLYIFLLSKAAAAVPATEEAAAAVTDQAVEAATAAEAARTVSAKVTSKVTPAARSGAEQAAAAAAGADLVVPPAAGAGPAAAADQDPTGEAAVEASAVSNEVIDISNCSSLAVTFSENWWNLNEFRTTILISGFFFSCLRTCPRKVSAAVVAFEGYQGSSTIKPPQPEIQNFPLSFSMSPTLHFLPSLLLECC